MVSVWRFARPDFIIYDAKYTVACSSEDKGTGYHEGLRGRLYRLFFCKKNCPQDAVTISNFHAAIDYEKCVGCGVCMSKCPRKSDCEALSAALLGTRYE